MKAVRIIGTDTLLAVMKIMFLRGEITSKDYFEAVRRNELLSKETRFDNVILR